MRIAFDGTTLRPLQTGIGYYTEHLLRHLVSSIGERDEIVIVSNRKVETSQPLPVALREYEGRRFPIRSTWMQFRAPGVVREIGADVAHFTNSIAPIRLGGPMVVTIHDMSLRIHPGYHPRRRVLTRPLLEWSAHRADAVITVSERARQDILKLTGIEPEKIAVIAEAAAPAFRPVTEKPLLEAVRKRYSLTRPFILFVGTIEPRKNLVGLLRAYARLRNSGLTSHQLVCVGALGWGYREVSREIERLALNSHVHLTGYVPFQDLPVIYNLADLLVLPSFYEGFGLPVLEAMACGLPVVTTRGTALQEVAGSAALLIDPHCTESLCDGIGSLVGDSELRRRLASRGLERAGLFSWDKAAAETLKVYRRVVERARRTRGGLKASD